MDGFSDDESGPKLALLANRTVLVCGSVVRIWRGPPRVTVLEFSLDPSPEVLVSCGVLRLNKRLDTVENMMIGLQSSRYCAESA